MDKRFSIFFFILFSLGCNCQPNQDKALSKKYFETALSIYMEDEKFENSSQEILINLDNALVYDSTSIEALRLKANVLLEVKRDQEALKVLRTLQDLKPNFAESFILCGKIYTNRNLIDSAKREFLIARDIISSKKTNLLTS